jgi:hypothetical protein
VNLELHAAKAPTWHICPELEVLIQHILNRSSVPCAEAIAAAASVWKSQAAARPTGAEEKSI